MPDSLLHRLIHRIPGVPAHRENKPHSPRPHNRTPNHTAGRPPRILAGWQRRIAALFGRDLP